MEDKKIEKRLLDMVLDDLRPDKKGNEIDIYYPRSGGNTLYIYRRINFFFLSFLKQKYVLYLYEQTAGIDSIYCFDKDSVKKIHQAVDYLIEYRTKGKIEQQEVEKLAKINKLLSLK